jgi:hypothetical protein
MSGADSANPCFSSAGFFPTEITEQEKTTEITEDYLKKLCDLCGKNSVISVGNPFFFINSSLYFAGYK